jgi:nicotinamidase-related amidase
VATWACVLKTVFDAAEMGYEVIVPADCCASPALEGHESALKVMGLLRVVKPSVKEVIETL